MDRYDLGEPFVNSDGNARVLNKTACDAGTCTPARDAAGKQQLACCWPGTDYAGSNCTDPVTGSKKNPCTDVWNCSLPDPATGERGRMCTPPLPPDIAPFEPTLLFVL